jgi:hypothetical protein
MGSFFTFDAFQYGRLTHDPRKSWDQYLLILTKGSIGPADGNSVKKSDLMAAGLIPES